MKKITSLLLSLVIVGALVLGFGTNITADPGDPVNTRTLFDPGDPVNTYKDPGDPINERI